MTEKTPSMLARETLKLLSARKLAPDPANFRAIYNEVAGTPDVLAFPEEQLRRIADALPAHNFAQQRYKVQIEGAIRRGRWSELQTALMSYADAGPTTTGHAVNAAPAQAGARPTDLLEPLARLVENIMPALGTDDARLAQQAAQLLEALRASGAEISSIKPALSNFNLRVSFAAEDQAELRSTLLKLLHVIIQNIGELSREDDWLKRQVDALSQAATPPLTLRRLDDVERRLKDVMFKQTEAKSRELAARDEMRRMVALFVERLTAMTQSAGEQHRRMEESARMIEQAKTLDQITPVLHNVVATTREIAQSIRRTHEELRAMREKVQATEAEINRLHQELDHASTQARHDLLTGALNRKGLDEALLRELSEVQRRNTPLCLSLLDIDNFKKFNDTRGHAAGDAALAHLVSVTRDSVRPQDTVARYGGEEFIILMPDTRVEQGVDAMVRLQRELTKRFFLDGDEKVIITFSAGVTHLDFDEAAQDAIDRADKAMYLAKRAGRNRVVAG